jgi:membrane protein implicated in regulation of membrane protease activity
MLWMALIMSLPLLGIALFFIYPWRVALIPYLILVAASVWFDWLMMRAIHLPVRSGRDEMIGSKSVVVNWSGNSGQVVWHGEIWRARGDGPFRQGDEVMIDGLSGLTLHVKSTGDL